MSLLSNLMKASFMFGPQKTTLGADVFLGTRVFVSSFSPETEFFALERVKVK